MEPAESTTAMPDKPLLKLLAILDQFPSDPDWPPGCCCAA
jgi:hypothetical protein